MWRTMILSFKQIGRNKIRSFLTILGIIIGVASVIVLINIIEGVKLQMIESYEKIGINTIEVNTYRKSDAFTLEELDQILAENPGRFAGYSPIVDIENVHMETETDAFVVHQLVQTQVGQSDEVVADFVKNGSRQIHGR